MNARCRIVNAAGGLVVNPDGKFLMIYRRGFWDLPKGKQEEDEPIEACALREVSEETGIPENKLLLGDFITMTTHYYELNGEEIEKHTYWYKMSVESGITLIPQIEEDITSVQWVTLEAAESNLLNSFDTIREVFSKGTM